MCGSRFHFHHWPLGRPGQVGCVAPFQHHAFDGVGILAGARACGIGACRGQCLPACEWHGGRQIDAGIVELADEIFQPFAPFRERQFAQIVLVVAEQIIGAQMDREFLDQLRRDDLAVEPLLQNVETLHAAFAQDQKLAVDRAGQAQRRHQIRKATRDVLAGARIEPRRDVAARVAACHRLHADAVPFPFGDVVGGIEVLEVGLLDRMRQHHGAERRGIAIDGLLAAAFQPGEQVEIGRAKPGPDQLDLMRVLVAERRGCGFCQTRGHTDAKRAGDQLQQRPAAGLIELVEPAFELLRHLGLAERAQRGDDLGEGWGWRVVVGGHAAFGHISATVSERSPT